MAISLGSHSLFEKDVPPIARKCAYRDGLTYLDSLSHWNKIRDILGTFQGTVLYARRSVNAGLRPRVSKLRLARPTVNQTGQFGKRITYQTV